MSTLLTALRRRGRTIVAASLLPVFGVLATGCSLGGSMSATPTPGAPLVRLWRYNQDIDPIRSTFQAFQSAHPNVVLKFKKKDLASYEITALKSMASLQGPDIWSIPNEWIGDEEDQLVPLPSDYFFSAGTTTGLAPADAVKKLFPAGVADQITRPDGSVDGIPTNLDTLQLYYNPDLFQTAFQDFNRAQNNNSNSSAIDNVRALLRNAPTTWNDLVDQTKYLTRPDGAGGFARSAIALGTADNVPNSSDILQLLMLQNGSRIVSSDRRSPLFQVPITTSAGVQVNPGAKALEFFSSFAQPGKPNYTWNPSMPSALDAFAQGKVAMVIGYSDFESQLKIKYPRFRAEKAAVPQISLPTVQTPVNFFRFSLEAVTQTANNKAAAFGLLKAYTSSDITDSLAGEIKMRSPYLSTLNRNTDDYLNTQAITAQSTFKLNRPVFDGAFRQMIVDASQNNVPATDAVRAGAEKIGAVLSPPAVVATPTPN